tara:strand:- start:211 stop:612 length:402 start_codon:yes stop_codon:yes gene_type:complete
MLTKLVMVLIMCSIVYSEWRWASDSMELTHDKEAHFVGSAGAYFFFRHKEYTVRESILYTFYLGLTKECIDAVVPWEEYGAWGGDGFSKYDLTYNIAGITIALLLDNIWKPKEDSKWERGFSNDSISISYRLY